MIQNTSLAKQVWDIFAAPKPPLREQYLQNLKSGKLEGEKIEAFTPFKKEHADRAAEVLDEFERIAGSNTSSEENAIQKVIAYFLSLQGRENPDLLYYVLKTFLVNYKGQLQFLIPSLLVREPELTIPSREGIQEIHEIAVGSPEETKLDWFREDPSLNEHHGHWHIVYSNRVRKDRQGEMFFYMHQQMIARYDADRLSEGVGRVIPFDNMRDNRIKVGYAAGEDVRLSGFILSGRDPRTPVDRTSAAEQIALLREIREDLAAGTYDPSHPLRMEDEIAAVNRFGSTIEMNQQGDLSKTYRNYHGNGHVYIGNLNQGVMFLTEAAIRDVVFWEWHKGVDDLYFELQQRFVPNNFSTDAPKVKFRKSIDVENKPYSPDLILCRKTDIASKELSVEQGQQLGEQMFNGANWEKDFAAGEFSYNGIDGVKKSARTVDTLQTIMNTGTIRYRENGQMKSYSYPYLSHEEFCYFIRLENTSRQQQLLTIRIFIVPEELAEDRRAWIEMDKFLFTLPADAKSVIYRSDDQASVIRKPAVKDPATYNIAFDPLRMPIDDRQCGCGWPYHMLLPKGKREGRGMAFKIMVMVTDAAVDLVRAEPNCGSLSFCGAKASQYPDKRPLGYPFNRQFAGNGRAIENAIRTYPNMLVRTIYIKHQTN